MIEHKMTLFVCDKSVALHAAQLGGQRTAVHAEVVGQLLTVERNVERVRAVLHRLCGQVRQQLAAHGFRTCVEDFSRQKQVFLRGDVQKIA